MSRASHADSASWCDQLASLHTGSHPPVTVNANKSRNARRARRRKQKALVRDPWQRVRSRRYWAIGTWLGFVAVILVVGRFNEYMPTSSWSGVIVIGLMAACAIASTQFSHALCPNCRKSFLSRSWWSLRGPFYNHCGNCGAVIGQSVRR